MNIVIIEDEKPAARLLQRELNALGYSVTAMLHSVEQALAYFEEHSDTDLIFADIQLGDGLSFDIFTDLNLHCSVIFVTSFDHYALQAFKTNSVDYLLKPVDPLELSNALDKFKKRQIGSWNQIASITSVVEQKSYAKRIMVPIASQIKVLQIAEISCIYKEQRAVYAALATGKRYLLSQQSLQEIEPLLDPNVFFRVSRQELVSIEHIEQINTLSNSVLRIKVAGHDQSIIVSRQKTSAFKHWLSKN